MRHRASASATTSTTTTTVQDHAEDVEAAAATAAPPASGVPASTQGSDDTATWYTPNPVTGDAVGSSWADSPPPTPPPAPERQPAPYQYSTAGAAGAEKTTRAKPRLGPFELMRTALCVLGLLCVLGASAGLRLDMGAANERGGGSPAAGSDNGNGIELQACRRTLANLRSRVAGLESASAAAQQGRAAADPAAAAAASAMAQRAPLLLQENGADDAGYAMMSEQLSSLQAELRLTKMTSWDLVGSGTADAEEEAHATQTAGGAPVAAINVAKSRRIAVRSAFLRAYGAYETYAFGYDDLKPLRRKGEDWLGMGATIVDSLDTMLLMGLSGSPQYARAREWVSSSLDLAPNRDISVFETSIRVLGGLLAAFSLTADQIYLEKAESLGSNLLFAFDTKTGIPSSTVNLAQGLSRRKMKNPLNGKAYTFGEATTLAEAGSVQLEYLTLGRLTGNETYSVAARRSLDALLRVPRTGKGKKSDVLPIDVHPTLNRFDSDRRSIGASGDSYYEYLLKLWIASRHWNAGGDEEASSSSSSSSTSSLTSSMPDKAWSAMLLNRYRTAVDAINKEMVGRSGGKHNYVFLGTRASGGSAVGRSMEHLACFAPGMLALGASTGEPALQGHLPLAKELMKTCYAMYASSPTGLAAEVSEFDGAGGIRPAASGWLSSGLLRPETVESLFIMYRVTGDETYREWGWTIFQAVERHGRRPESEGGGYTAIENVNAGGSKGSLTGKGSTKSKNGAAGASPKRLDRLDSFFLAETLKYFYLLFSPAHTLNLNEFVLNTEGHPMMSR
jgi:mannosyl-oligosaccharide alpha-1,2-mannosidase